MNTAALWSGFQAGFWHPIMLPMHAVALVGLGLMIGQQTRRQVTLLVFALGLPAGLLALALAVGETPAGSAVLLGTAAAGLAVAIGWPLPTLIAAPLAALIGAGIGLDSPPKALSIQAANATLVGTALGGLVAVGVVAAVAARLHRGWPSIVVRVLGSWIAASAILVLALRLAR